VRRSILESIAPTLLAALPLAAAVDFRTEVQPVLERYCISCHGASAGSGELRLHDPAVWRKGPHRDKLIVPGKPDASRLVIVMELPEGTPGVMPLVAPFVPRESIAKIRAWIAEGAHWPEGLVIGPRKAGREDDLALVRDIHKRIAAKPAPPRMEPYKVTIPATDVSFDMVPVQGGEFVMGTPPGERGRRDDEGPQHKVKVEPLWMAAREVTWDEYRLFMFARDATEELVDGVSRPTRPYVEMSFGMGINGYPAISMTHHAASKYAQWLSAKTGHFYRLPTEAEWEYACRAGAQTAYSFGDDGARLGEYAWFDANSDSKYALVGRKKPNAWGLYDMHGNVSEWVLDQYVADFYAKKGGLLWAPSKTPYPHVVRGGSWAGAAEECRCGARQASDPSWKQQDPQLPKSIWYLTDAQWVGFRLVRPLRVPSAQEIFRYWNSGVEQE
jgi:formylglycine-generating enzyme required for sulfatase activity/mono/diheme cytochrome c family protein